MTLSQHNNTQPAVVLIPGHWLGSWAWDQVRDRLTAAGMRAIAMTLPGLDPHDPDRVSRTLEDQADAIRTLIDAEDRNVVLVAHSGANFPVSLILDQCPERVDRVIWVDSGPVATGSVFAPDLPETVGELPLPPFETLGEYASLDGLSPDGLDRFRAKAVPEPGPVARAAVHLTNDARHHVPTTLVCCSLPSTQIMGLAEGGHPMFAEVTKLQHLDAVDLPTGHWPMWSRAEDLAAVIERAVLTKA